MELQLWNPLMEFEYKSLPENINVSDINPITNVLKMFIGLFLIVVTVVFVVIFSIKLVAPHISFEFEKKIADAILAPPNKELSKKDLATQRALQNLTDKLAFSMDLPEGMDITVRYEADSDLVNAFAMLGGYVIVHRGLLGKMESENALAMVLGHEITHIKNRDVLTSMSSSLIVSIIAAITVGNEDSNITAMSSSIALLSYSRSIEKKADIGGFNAVNKYYGHINGAQQFLTVFSEEGDDEYHKYLTFLRSHPTSKKRKAALDKMAEENGWIKDGKITPLSGSLKVKKLNRMEE